MGSLACLQQKKLINFVQNVCNAFHNRTRIDSIYIDFAKPFDKINHHILVNKLSFFDFSLQLLNLITSYLKQRKQYVAHCQSESFSYAVNSGVRQGSNLCPLFSYYILMIYLPQ
jgi:hypothetical protein